MIELVRLPDHNEPMTNAIIRRARAEDAIALARCIDAAYAIYVGRVPDLPAVSKGIAEDIETHLVWVADIDGEIAGGLVLVAQDNHAQLANIAVDPTRTGLGLGRALIGQAEMACRELGLPELRLATHVDMPENVALYAHLGWQETERRGNKVLMAKRL